MWMRALSIVFSYLLGRTLHSDTQEKSFLLNAATLASLRKTLALSAGVLAGLVIFFGGLFTILVDMILATRGEGQLAFSQASLVGSALIVISFLVELALFSRGNWQPLVVQPEQADQPKVQPIAEALADLIREFTEERKYAREQRSEQMSTTSATARPAYN